MAFDPGNKHTHAYPAAIYQTSNFRKILQRYPKNTITEAMVKRGLNDSELSTWESINSDYTLAQKGACFWTHNNYRDLQVALRDDDKKKLEDYMPLIRAINLYICNHPTEAAMITFRKSKIKGNQLKAFKEADEGKVFRHAGYTATTLDINQAIRWGGSAIIKYIIPQGCLNAREITQISRYPSEKEVLLPPYTAVEFVSLKNKISKSDISGDVDNSKFNQIKDCPLITLKVLDNFIISGKEKLGLITHAFKETNEYEMTEDNKDNGSGKKDPPNNRDEKLPGAPTVPNSVSTPSKNKDSRWRLY